MVNILVADDDSLIRHLVRALLEAEGHQVTEAADGVEAIQAARACPYDVVLCDVFMPRQDGIQTLRQLRQELPGLPVVSMSAGGFGGKVDMLSVATLLGAAGVLPKPFNRADLLGVVARALGSGQKQ